MKEKQENTTLEDVKKDIIRRIQRGESYREIVKTKYKIDGIIKKFSISELSKIKQEISGQTINSKDKDPNAALLFELFTKNISQHEAVVKTHLSPEYVREKHEQFLQMKYADKEANFLRVMFEMAGWMKGRETSDIDDVQYYLENAIIHFLEPEDGNLCDACENPGKWERTKLNS